MSGQEHYAAGAQAQAAIFEYIEVYYNLQRRSAAIGNAAPVKLRRRSGMKGLCERKRNVRNDLAPRLFLRRFAAGFFALALLLPLAGCTPKGGVTAKELKRKLQAEVNVAYTGWKRQYVKTDADGVCRVANPQDGGATVSEGIGYGMLFSAAMGDRSVFDGFWRYARKHLDKNGLMNWKIGADGATAGSGSACDADQDMAYALLKAAKNWNDGTYTAGASSLLAAIEKHELRADGLLLPGDSWGSDSLYNPSYTAPSYYGAFASAAGDVWLRARDKNLDMLQRLADSGTGLLPDWSRMDGSAAAGKDTFGYDAIRVPIRLLRYAQTAGAPAAQKVLEKEYAFVASKKVGLLKAGYTLGGKAETGYLNVPYLASYAAMSAWKPQSPTCLAVTEKLVGTEPEDYYGSSLRLWVILILQNIL